MEAIIKQLGSVFFFYALYLNGNNKRFPHGNDSIPDSLNFGFAPSLLSLGPGGARAAKQDTVAPFEEDFLSLPSSSLHNSAWQGNSDHPPYIVSLRRGYCLTRLGGL